jgi:hypothetical protein
MFFLLVNCFRVTLHLEPPYFVIKERDKGKEERG